ncbi:MAG: septum formation protein Maf [Candidatus Marinimicrobia bacterium]|nr:septum formation protein Maf [Candidatus Neomarinimicrobiota bacterium]
MQWILASSSPRRKQLLETIDLKFDIVHPNVNESLPFLDLSPSEFCCMLADLKAKHVSESYPESIVIGADTIVIKGKKIMGKPKNRTDAITILQRLSGCTHQVITGVSIQCEISDVHHTFYESTDVTFKDLSQSEIEHYVDCYSPFDKAGSYGIQDFSAIFVSSIQGCYHNVVGFPLSRFSTELAKIGIFAPWLTKNILK